MKIAKSACADKRSLIYSHFENTLGASAMEMNDLAVCEESLRSSLNIRRELLEPTNEDLLCTMNNYANLLNAEGKIHEAVALYTEVRPIREGMGPETEVSLAITYMGLGQVLFQIDQFLEAELFYLRALEIVRRTYGPEGHFVAQYDCPGPLILKQH